MIKAGWAGWANQFPFPTVLGLLASTVILKEEAQHGLTLNIEIWMNVQIVFLRELQILETS